MHFFSWNCLHKCEQFFIIFKRILYFVVLNLTTFFLRSISGQSFFIFRLLLPFSLASVMAVSGRCLVRSTPGCRSTWAAHTGSPPSGWSPATRRSQTLTWGSATPRSTTRSEQWWTPTILGTLGIQIVQHSIILIYFAIYADECI